MNKPKTSSLRSRRAGSAALLLLAFLALVLGVYGAVYFQGSESPPPAKNAQAQPSAAPAPTAQPPQAAAPAENKPQEQMSPPRESAPPEVAEPEPQAAQAPPPALVPMAPERSEILPQNEMINVRPVPDNEAIGLAQISPSAAPADIAAVTPSYWVEFGAYAGGRYAERLKRSLDQAGIGARVDSTPGKDGRTYSRVRSSDDSDYVTAAAQLAKARSALHVAPLLHRVAAVSPAPARPPAARAAPIVSDAYWVQFGAFRERQNAAQAIAELRKRDVQATVIKKNNGDPQPLYLIRVSSLADRSEAERIAQRGSAALQTNDILIGETHAASGLHPRPPPR